MFDVGDCVIINERCNRYKDRIPPGIKGTLTRVYRTGKGECKIGVSVTGVINPYSDTGTFWFKESQLTNTLEQIDIIKKQLNIKENNKMFNLANFEEGYKVYDLMNPVTGESTLGVYYGELTPGSYVVCNYGYSNGALSVRIVSDVITEVEVVAVDCEVMGAADISAYAKRKEKIAKRKELKNKMKQRMAKYNEEMAYKMLAEHDEEMAALYKEYSEI